MNNQTVNELNNRNLDSCYFSIICFPTNIYFKSSEIDINQKTLYVFYGCNLKGVRKFITAVISDDFSFLVISECITDLTSTLFLALNIVPSISPVWAVPFLLISV